MDQNSLGDQQPVFEYSWTPTKTRKKRKGRTPPETQTPSELLDRTMQELLSNTSWMDHCERLLKHSLVATMSSTSADVEVLCLGLGSPTVSRAARAQLAFLLDLTQRISIAPAAIRAFDPVFTSEDERLLEHLKIGLIKENKRAVYPIQAPTVLFMPHCGVRLYENVLRANWAPSQLERMIFLANDFAEYTNSLPDRTLAHSYPCLHRLQRHLIIEPLPLSPTFSTAFNNLAVQFVNVDELWPSSTSRLPTCFPTSAGTTSAAVSQVIAESHKKFWTLPPESEDGGGQSETDLEVV